MLTVALTGGIGCGKSAVCHIFSTLKVPVIDTDVIAHQLVKPGQPALKEITATFGKDILLEDATLDRKKLAKIIYTSAEKRTLLEAILHPKIKQSVEQQLRALKHSAYVIIAIPLLVETNQTSTYDRVLVVDCDEQLQHRRTLNRDNRTIDEINAIIKAQAPRQLRLSYADDVINNSHDISSLEKQVEQYHQKYLQLASANNHHA